jgi:hypothetical protein
MKNLIFNHTSEDGGSITIHKSGSSWLSCMGQIDEALVHYCGEDATLATHLSDMEEVCATLEKGEVHSYFEMGDWENAFTLTPTDKVAADWDGMIKPSPVAEWLNTKPFDGGAQ